MAELADGNKCSNVNGKMEASGKKEEKKPDQTNKDDTDDGTSGSSSEWEPDEQDEPGMACGEVQLNMANRHAFLAAVAVLLGMEQYQCKPKLCRIALECEHKDWMNRIASWYRHGCPILDGVTWQDRFIHGQSEPVVPRSFHWASVRSYPKMYLCSFCMAVPAHFNRSSLREYLTIVRRMAQSMTLSQRQAADVMASLKATSMETIINAFPRTPTICMRGNRALEFDIKPDSIIGEAWTQGTVAWEVYQSTTDCDYARLVDSHNVDGEICKVWDNIPVEDYDEVHAPFTGPEGPAARTYLDLRQAMENAVPLP